MTITVATADRQIPWWREPTADQWLADRVGRKTPLMISILWYSICNFIAGFSPAFWFLFLFRALLGIGMGPNGRPVRRWRWSRGRRARAAS